MGFLRSREMVVLSDSAAGPGFLRLRGEKSGHVVDVADDQPDQVQQALKDWDTLSEQ
jgi:hypothetical protein